MKEAKVSKPGIFITFEGGEGSGKTTLIAAIASILSEQGRSVLKVREPGGTELGEAVRNLLLHAQASVSPYAELSLFLASRAQHIAEVIRPALAAGKIVLCDRFNDSTIAYQGGARGLGMEKVEAVCRFICQNLQPHLTLYLDLDPQIGLMRVKKSRSQDRIEAEDLSFHVKIREFYLAIHKKDPKRFHLLNAAASPSEVCQQAMAVLKSFC